jgi:hypothetical protein
MNIHFRPPSSPARLYKKIVFLTIWLQCQIIVEKPLACVYQASGEVECDFHNSVAAGTRRLQTPNEVELSIARLPALRNRRTSRISGIRRVL